MLKANFKLVVVILWKMSIKTRYFPAAICVKVYKMIFYEMTLDRVEQCVVHRSFQLGVAAHTFNLSTQEAEAGGSM